MLPLEVVVAATTLLAAAAGTWLLRSTPKAERGPRGEKLDPAGGTRLKNLLGYGMALIAKHRERQACAKASLRELEAFHKPEPHPFFNESFYFHGCDRDTGDHVSARLSRHGSGAEKSYVVFFLDIAGVGIFSFERDDVPVSDAARASGRPSACGLELECLEPMRKWRLRFDGKMRRGCHTPQQARTLSDSDLIEVDVDLVYERQTPVFYYMRDDCAETLANNLSQEPWGIQFAKVCLNRSKNHGHYEDFGTLSGTVRINGISSREYAFDTFRDHSWDIRRWATMDSVLILLVTLEEPLHLFGHEYWFLDLTLVSMPGNTSGVARYSTGYMLPKESLDPDAPVLCLVRGTSILDVPWVRHPDGTREPEAETDVVMYVRPEAAQMPAIPVRVHMSGTVRRLIYYPDGNQFQYMEDGLDFRVTNLASGQQVKAYGSRQSGFRQGDFDPSLGGCG
ncbi:Hypothetical Protein FCC1311_029552 [Hondaea fermentalgiana]|uniref:Uncharacterized protein n=1 Tax=Hondaea fermentalgiana TaxID=2315210 RepID=A0A2R5GFU1_9STRA|nr:Hypothetical Protein FCC1311_029552 [Hondaea fermentalgiana]|eukprot:GBG26734.1 Hypothetical Protein FCC1311_029552 [Hondaea fermentalgiana]